MRPALLAAIAGLGLTVASAAPAQDGGASGVSRDLLGAGSPAAAAGQELSLRRVTFAPRASIPGEVHSGMQVVYVVSGRLGLQVLGGVAVVRRAQPGGGMSAPEEVRPGPKSIVLGPGDTVLEGETLVLHPYNPGAEPLVILAASLLQAGKPQSVPIEQPVTPGPRSPTH